MNMATRWNVGRCVLDLTTPRIMGILNVTPDSFSDGGELADVDAAVRRSQEMIEQGASIIDIGPESTRPGAPAVSESEQIDRAVPVIRAIRETDDTIVMSIDTTRAAVARAALGAGADVINDVSAGEDDEAMLGVAARAGCGLVLMHRKCRPTDDRYSDQYDDQPQYDDVVTDVIAYLRARCEAAERAGVEPDRMVIDPGLGFGKTVDQNLTMVARFDEFVVTGRPVLAASSRKSFIGAVTGESDPRRRVAASLALTVTQFMAGARIFRVHDVAEHRQTLDVTMAVLAASETDEDPVRSLV